MSSYSPKLEWQKSPLLFKVSFPAANNCNPPHSVLNAVLYGTKIHLFMGSEPVLVRLLLNAKLDEAGKIQTNFFSALLIFSGYLKTFQNKL